MGEMAGKALMFLAAIAWVCNSELNLAHRYTMNSSQVWRLLTSQSEENDHNVSEAAKVNEGLHYKKCGKIETLEAALKRNSP